MAISAFLFPGARESLKAYEAAVSRNTAMAKKQRFTPTAAIIPATITNITLAEKPLALLLRSLQNALDECLGPDPDRNTGYEQMPPDIATQIIGMTARRFPPYLQAQTGNAAEAQEQFFERARQGLDQGYREAGEVLGGLGSDSDSAALLDQTFAQVQQRLNGLEQQLVGTHPSTDQT